MTCVGGRRALVAVSCRAGCRLDRQYTASLLQACCMCPWASPTAVPCAHMLAQALRALTWALGRPWAARAASVAQGLSGPWAPCPASRGLVQGVLAQAARKASSPSRSRAGCRRTGCLCWAASWVSEELHLAGAAIQSCRPPSDLQHNSKAHALLTLCSCAVVMNVLGKSAQQAQQQQGGGGAAARRG